MYYNYWVLRYVPDAIRGEFINIGVVAGIDGQDWAIRRVRDFRHASALGGSASSTKVWLDHFEASLSLRPSVGGLFDGTNEPTWPGASSTMLERLRTRLNNTVQLSPAAPVVADNAQSAASLMFNQLVLERRTKQARMTRSRVADTVRYEFNSHPDLHGRIRNRPYVTVGKQSARLDFVVGKADVRQITHAWSFELKSVDNLEQEIRAWNYFMQRIRNDGGYLRSSRDSKDGTYVPSQVPVRVVYAEPQSEPQANQLEIALEAWSELSIEAFPMARVERVAEEASRLLAV
jgi:hypothetical protein